MSFKTVLPALAETLGRARPARDEKSRPMPKRVEVGAGLHWRRIGSGWRLFDGRRRFGAIVYPNMWRPVLAGGRLGEMANITWAKHAVLEAAVRELEWEGRRNRATDPSKCPEKRRGPKEGQRLLGQRDRRPSKPLAPIVESTLSPTGATARAASSGARLRLPRLRTRRPRRDERVSAAAQAIIQAAVVKDLISETARRVGCDHVTQTQT